MAFSLLIASVPLGLRVFYKWLILESDIPPVNALAWVSSVIAGLQSLFFAMCSIWSTKDLRGNR